MYSLLSEIELGIGSAEFRNYGIALNDMRYLAVLEERCVEKTLLR
jgi:hypothetical protein